MERDYDFVEEDDELSFGLSDEQDEGDSDL
jgi:hypothetical protein